MAEQMRHIISAAQFNHEDLDDIFERADYYKDALKNLDQRKQLRTKYVGRIATMLFYQPSTRTKLSFETAAKRLGMDVMGTEDAEVFSSAAKGETIEDTVRVLSEYDHDIIVIRHNKTGATADAAAVSEASIINAGEGKDGMGEHPTQALLDAYTIHRHHGRLDNLHVVMGGDLRLGRTVRSLAHILSKYKDNRISFVSVPEFQITDDIKLLLDEHGTSHHETADMLETFHDADVIYWTRLQAENLAEHQELPKGGFVIDPTALEVIPKSSIIMHPLPRVDEIKREVDQDPRAVYFTQAGNGVPVRMAAIEKVLSSRGT